jgi:hypothetical protein
MDDERGESGSLSEVGALPETVAAGVTPPAAARCPRIPARDKPSAATATAVAASNASSGGFMNLMESTSWR